MKKLLNLLAVLATTTTLAQTAGDYKVFRKGAGIGDSTRYVAKVNNSLWSLNANGMLTFLAQSNFANASHVHAASDITSGVLATARLGTGTASTSTYLRGDGSWQTVSSGSGDVVGPSSATDNNVPQWDGTTGKLLKNGLGTSNGGNGAADSGKLLRFGLEGQLRGTVENSTTGAIVGESSGTGYAGFFNSGGVGETVKTINGASGAGLFASSSSGNGVDAESTYGIPLHVHAVDVGATDPDIAEFAEGLSETVRLRVRSDGGLNWTGTGAQTTATALPAFGTSTKGVVPASGGGTSNFLRADGTWAAPGGGGGVAWGAITGTLSDQTDLSSYLETLANGIGAVLPDQTGNSGKFLTTDGSVPAWQTLDAAALGASTAGASAFTLSTPATRSFARYNTDGSVALRTYAEVISDLDVQPHTAALDAVTGTNTGNQTISITGDVTAAGSTGTLTATVTKINGTALSGLATGILKNTTSTGVPSIAVAGDFPTLNQNTTGSAATLTTSRTIQTDLASTSSASFNGSANITPGVTGVLPIANGGSGSSTAGGALTNMGIVHVGVTNFTFNSATYTNLTGASATLAANTRYSVKCMVNYTTPSTSTGIGISVTMTGSPTARNLNRAQPVAATGTVVAQIPSDDAGSIATASLGTTELTSILEGNVLTSGSNCTLQLRVARGGTSNTITILSATILAIPL